MTTAAEETETTITTASNDAETVITVEERPIHLARCAECAIAVKFQPNASGTGFLLIDVVDTIYGVGENGRPICPNGHGEMEIADDKIPAADAFALVNEQLDAARQPRLPIPTPPFNYEGVLHALCDKRHIIAALERKVEDRKSALKRAKDDLDEENLLLGKMLDEFEKNEQDRKDEIERRAHEAEAEAPRLVRCTWDALHPDCPCALCSDETVATVVEHILNGPPQAPTDAQGHVEEVERFLAGLEVEETVNQLENANTFIAERVVREWTSEDRKAVILWACWQEDRLNNVALPTDDDGAFIAEPVRPSVLGRPHVPAPPQRTEDGEEYLPQRCAICDAVLPREDATDAYRETDYIGVDCKGKAPVAEHHYPEKKAKKPAKRKAAKE